MEAFAMRPIWSKEMMCTSGLIGFLSGRRIYIRKAMEMFTKAVMDCYRKTLSHLISPSSLQGETGTGKSELARKIHRESGRGGNFVQINLSSFSEGLIESELFGHVKGAFTGAVSPKRGAIIEANRGTLFLDEIDSLPISIQTKLLLFLDSKKIRAVGSHTEEKVDARLIFASGRNLRELTGERMMRRDFYYRISSGVTLTLKPLRNDKEKIKDICDHFFQKEGLSIPGKLMEFYLGYHWPGNIRQLLGHLNKKKVMCHKYKWDFDHLDEELIGDALSLIQEHKQFCTIEELKQSYAYKVYLSFDRSVKDAAKMLNITPNTLRALLKKRKGTEKLAS